MVSSIPHSTLQRPLLSSQFLAQNHLRLGLHKTSFPVPKQPESCRSTICAKFDLFKIMGGRGLCNGEKGIKQELSRNIQQESSVADINQENDGSSPEPTLSVPEDAFEKEMMGLTGGFPGGEKGLKKFIDQNPPPKKTSIINSGGVPTFSVSKKPKPPELPLLMPGMIAIVKNPNNPFYMYCGIVQRITDGKAGVLFEGGNWDRLITFRLEELERREKGPPMKNPKSAVLEPLLQQASE